MYKRQNIRQYILENDWLDAIIRLSTSQFMNTPIGTYIWVISKNKPDYRVGKVQLIDASECYKVRRRPIGKKRNDITTECAKLIVQAYGEYKDDMYYGIDEVWCESKIFPIEEFGYKKIVVERPLYDENGKIIHKNGKPVADTALRDSELVPMKIDIDEYLQKEIKPYEPDAWIDKKKTKIGYEIPMIRYFYNFPQFKGHDELFEELKNIEATIQKSMKILFED